MSKLVRLECCHNLYDKTDPAGMLMLKRDYWHRLMYLGMCGRHW